MRTPVLFLLVSIGTVGCAKLGTPKAPIPVNLPTAERSVFNERAIRQHLPYFWVYDDAPNGLPKEHELAWLWTGEAPTPVFVDGRLNHTILPLIVAPPPDTTPRHDALRLELDAGRPTLVLTDVEPDEQTFVRAMLDVGNALEALHAQQRGTHHLKPADDGLSRAVFRRNQGPWCEENPSTTCTATLEPSPRHYGVYPADIQTPGFCTSLEAQPELMEPFTAVRSVDGTLEAVPYSDAWPEASARAAAALQTAAQALPATESALADYLNAAATSFGDNDWERANRAWLATRESSEWYVRVGPDETYWEPCNRKAGYHLVFARINPASLTWQQTLEPLKADLETAMAERSGPYVARDVSFSLPEFIDIVLNAGDARSATGGTTGQSLPNWGPVAEAGGRTVAMTNLNNDPDSLTTRRERTASIFCNIDSYTDDPEPLLVSTVLHEAAHNLGPASGYTVDGKTDEEAFGGELATMLEELKAQTAALYFTDWLVERDVVTRDFATRAHMADLVWMMGQISQGLTNSEGRARAYPQLSAIQLGVMMEAGAVTWRPDQTAANGTDTGCLHVDHAALPAAIDGLADTVFGIKGRADAQAGLALRAAHVEGAHDALFATITERWRRGPGTSFVYGFRGL